MAAEEVTIDECNATRISVFLDANVIIKAIRDSTRGGPAFAMLNAIDRPLRLFSSTTLFEVAFSRRGAAEQPCVKIRPGCEPTRRESGLQSVSALASIASWVQHPRSFGHAPTWATHSWPPLPPWIQGACSRSRRTTSTSATFPSGSYASSCHRDLSRPTQRFGSVNETRAGEPAASRMPQVSWSPEPMMGLRT